MRYPVRKERLILANPDAPGSARGSDAFGLRRRAHLVPLHKGPPPNEPPLTTPDKVARFLAGLGPLPQEQLVVVPLNSRNVPLGAVLASKGTADTTIVSPREILAPVIESRATAFLVAHNHPSGSCTPSFADLVATRRIAKLGHLLGAPLLDHVVVGDGCHASLRERSPDDFKDDARGEMTVTNPGERRMTRRSNRRRNAPLSRVQARALCGIVRRHRRRCGNPLTRAETSRVLRTARGLAKRMRALGTGGDPWMRGYYHGGASHLFDLAYYHGKAKSLRWATPSAASGHLTSQRSKRTKKKRRARRVGT